MESIALAAAEKPERYRELLPQLRALLDGEPDLIANPGHIACNAGSRSEIVVPIVRRGEVVAVLDLDSYERAAFDDTDAAGLQPIAELLATLAW